MSKKRYFILSPHYNDEDREQELRANAEKYYGTKDYEEVNGSLTSVFDKIMSELVSEGECKADILLMGVTIVAISEADSVYIARDWDEDEVCKICHLLAFKYGIEIVYESF